MSMCPFDSLRKPHCEYITATTATAYVTGISAFNITVITPINATLTSIMVPHPGILLAPPMFAYCPSIFYVDTPKLPPYYADPASKKRCGGAPSMPALQVGPTRAPLLYMQ